MCQRRGNRQHGVRRQFSVRTASLGWKFPCLLWFATTSFGPGGGSSAPLMKLLVRSLMALSTTRQCSLRLSVNFTAIICHEDESELFHGHVRCRPGVLGVCPICIPAFCSKQWLREMHSGRCSLGSSLQFRVTKKLRPSSPAC